MRQADLLQAQLGSSLGHLVWKVQSRLREQGTGKRGELAADNDPSKAGVPLKTTVRGLYGS